MLRGFVGIAILVSVSPLRAQAPRRDTPPAGGTAVIRGRVIAAGDDRPLPKVEVRMLPADYSIVAVATAQIGQARDPEFLERIQPTAARVTIREGETKVLDLKLMEPR